MNVQLDTAQKYRPALLWLMGQVDEARTAYVLTEFDCQLGHLIVPEHRELTESGHIRWEDFVHWSRLVLVQAGLMARGKRGVWAISQAGRQWLRLHPDGGTWREIEALAPEATPDTNIDAAGEEPMKETIPARSARPQTLRTAMDYRPALLWLLGEIGGLPAARVVDEFGRRFDDLIPKEHRELNKSGRVRWDEFVRWGRQDLVGAGLMDAEKRGYWTISAAGRTWLQTHPDGGGQELIKLLNESRSSSTDAPVPTASSASLIPKRQAVLLRGQTYMLSGPEVLTAARSAIANGMPRDATRFKDWFLTIDGQRVSVKWVVGLITGLPHSDFQTSEASRVLRSLGLEVEAENNVEAQVNGSSTESQVETLDYTGFFRIVQDHLRSRLPASLSNQWRNQRANFTQIGCPIRRSHYELSLRRAFTEIAVHFEGNREQNLKVLRLIHPHLESLQNQLAEPVYGEPWGERWAKVYIKHQIGMMDRDTAAVLADDWLRFILATLPILELIAGELGPSIRRRRSATEAKQEDLSRQRTILAEEIRAIRGFLAGNQGAVPSDEKLCDWVQFCYSFELFTEAASLFKLVRREQVNEWLYERVKRQARVCELHTNHGR